MSMGPGPVGGGLEADQFVIYHHLPAGRVLPDLPESIVSITAVVFCGVAALLWVSSMIPFRRSLRLYSIRTPEGSRVFGFLIFAAAMTALVLALAWGRSGSLGAPGRYALLTCLGCALFILCGFFMGLKLREIASRSPSR
jgi:peptidoglycan/LPS O-acetylase OafA/YrhL